jgi:hypothetical protein
VIAALHRVAQDDGRVTLDFTQCTAAFAGGMLAVCSQVMALRARKVEVAFDMPTDAKLSRMFTNCNWAFAMDPARHRPSRFRGHTHVPATPFCSASEQQVAVNAIVETILRSLDGIERGDLAAIEWSLNEMTDNVLVHAESSAGGLVQVTTFQRSNRRVEFVVADAGSSIPATLRGSRPELTSDPAALEQAIREGVTRDPTLGQGNGLFGAFEVCRASRGYFGINSRNATLDFDDSRGLHVRWEKIPFMGTMIVACFDCAMPGVLGEALRFGGKKHSPVDHIELQYEPSDTEAIQFRLASEAASFGSRQAGEPVRVKLANLARMTSHRIVIDFDGIGLVSSSFADEVFGKLFVQLGAMGFVQRFQFVNVSVTVRALVDRSISQRLATG